MGKECLLNNENFYCDNNRLPNTTFAKMNPEALSALIKSDGYKIVAKKGFLLSAHACGLSWGTIEQIVEPYLPKGKMRAYFLSKNPKKVFGYPVSHHVLEQFIKANGYEIVKTQGICAAARASELSRVTVRKIMSQHPPKEPYIRTNWAHRKTGEHNNKRRLSAPIRPKTLERFIKGNGYEIAKIQGMGAAASACGLNICSVAKILNQLPKQKKSK